VSADAGVTGEGRDAEEYGDREGQSVPRLVQAYVSHLTAEEGKETRWWELHDSYINVLCCRTGRLRECGIMRKLRLHASKEMPEIEVPLVTVDFKTLEPVILVLAIGTVVAPALLIFELILHRTSLRSVKHHVTKT
jgi:hypothetical protein